MIRKLFRYAVVAATVALAACSLAIDNPGAGDTKRVEGTPDDAEALISTYWKRWASGVTGNVNTLEGQAGNMSMMNFGTLANNCLNSHLPFSGISIVNASGYVCAPDQYRLYSFMGEVDRVASTLLSQMDNGKLILGNTNPLTDARQLRARAWAEFLRGLALGSVALMHDSAAIISPTMGAAAADCVPDASGTCLGAYRPYTEVMDSAMAAFTRSLAYTATPVTTGVNGFPIPNSWLPSPTNFTTTEFSKLIHTYMARFRAMNARTPAERAAVDWVKVIADAQAGITADYLVTTSTTTGPGNSWRGQYESFGTWHQMSPFWIGMADNSGTYATWVATPLASRGAGLTPFTMVTTDLRFPQGATRAAQQTDLVIANNCTAAATPCKRYFVNRPTANDNVTGAGWGWTNYDFVRFHSWVTKGDANSAQNGNTLWIPFADLNLLQAEGQYRQGNFAAAANLVNISRTAGMCTFSAGPPLVQYACGGGLPAIVVADGCPVPTPGSGAVCGTPVPGGANCVPKIPAGSFTTVQCGNLWEALKYEKRIETMYVTYAPTFLDGRGWGDLPVGTPIYWPVPYQDWLARGKLASALYGTGPAPGSPANSVAGPSNYGW